MRLIILSFLLLYASGAGAANSSKNFGGIGIDGAPWADGRIVVKQLVAGGPAHLAGVKLGDIIVQIDGKETAGSNFREMVDYRLRGRAGTPITIKVRRPGETKVRTFDMVRRQLMIPPNRQKSKAASE